MDLSALRRSRARQAHGHFNELPTIQPTSCQKSMAETFSRNPKDACDAISVSL